MATARQEATRDGTWRLEEAKARLSEVVRRAGSEGPQRVTVRGRPAAVVLSAEEYERLSGPAGASPTCSPTCAAAASPTSCRSATGTPAGTSSSPSEPLAAVAGVAARHERRGRDPQGRPGRRGPAGLGHAPETSGWISVLTLAEFAQGIDRLPPADPRRPAFEAQLAEVARRFAGRTLPVDAAVALRFGRLAGALTRAGRRPPVIDALLAATAIEHGMTLVTRNVGTWPPPARGCSTRGGKGAAPSAGLQACGPAFVVIPS
jgi:prevent-host-death family protein